VVSIVRGDLDRYDNRTLGFFALVISVLWPGGDEKTHRNPEEEIGIVDSFLEFSTADYELWLYGFGQYLGLNEEVENPLSGGIRDYDFKVSATLFIVGFEYGFNPVELADFILGLVTIDIMGDDKLGREKEPEDDDGSKKTEKKENKDDKELDKKE
jgi:hypothetical protein